MSDTTTEVKVPKALSELKQPELLAAAAHFGSDEKGNAKELLASLVTDGITIEQYNAVFHPQTEKPVEQQAAPAPGTITNETLDEIYGEEEEEVVAVEAVITAPENADLAPKQKYLIKMTRKNPYFEFKHHKFTQERPYAIMNANDAQEILSTEEGFRQAFPAELEEFYS
jgi:hypothetical protein